MLPFFENKQEQIFRAHVTELDFPAHLHSHIELYYVVRGKAEVWMDAQWYPVEQGALAVVFPGKVHAYRTLRKGKGVLLILPISLAHACKQMFHTQQPACPVLAAGQISPQLADNMAELADTTTQDAVAQALGQLILGRLSALLTLVPRTPYEADDLLCQAVGIIGQRYRTDVQLHDVAMALGVSEGHLSRILGGGIGMNFCNYINSLRVGDARHLLEHTQLSMLEIAFECGFQTLRTFNRAFLQDAGCTPSAYRRGQA